MYSEMDGMEVQAEHTPPAPPFCPQGQLYTVVAGDSLFLIAQRFGISLQELIAANPQIENPNLIFPGQLICVPVATVPPPPPCPGRTYTVVQGDTLFEIAQRFGVSLQALIAANPQITNPDLIFPGQVICIPVVTQPCPTGITYTVMPGDTLFGIAQRFGVTVEAILRLNPQIVNPDQLQVGETLCLPEPCPVVEPLPPAPPPMPCPEMPVPPPMPCPETPVPPPMPCPEPVLPIMPEPVPCPSWEQGPYPAPPGVPMPYPYYQGSFIYAHPPVNWDECPYARPRRRRRRLCLRRRRIA